MIHLEAAARGLWAFHASPWVGEIGEGLTTIAVEIQEPVPEKAEVKHYVRVKDFRQWLDARGTTRAQITAKDRVREILGETAEPTDREKRRRWAEERNR